MPLSISEKLSTFNSLVKSLLFFIEHSNSSVEHDRYDEVNCVNVYIEKLLIIIVPNRILGRELKVMLMVMMMTLMTVVVVMMTTIGAITQRQLMLGVFLAGI